ncbi:MAG: phosphoenolpyruvate synthase, partial [Ginsengibacter sp.]
MENQFILELSEVGINDIEKVGGKNASLGEMIQNLSSLGINIPNGFVITVAAYREFLQYNNLEGTIRHIVGSIDYDNIESLRRGGQQVRILLQNGRFPKEMSEVIIKAYEELSSDYQQDYTDVAVRSSATAEDLPDASFAGQQETFLNVRGPATLMDCVRNCLASLFTDRAISYRERFKYDHFAVGLSICVQKMVRSDLGSSGVAFSIDTESGFKDVVVINGAFGLGELVVQGTISPDEFIVFKPTLKNGYKSIIEKKLGVKDKMMVYGDRSDERVKIIPTETGSQNRFCLSDDSVLQLSDWVMKIEDYYTQLRNKWTPMDVEWAFDGLSKELFIVQARPETIHSQADHHKVTEYSFKHTKDQKVLLEGIAVGDKIGAGKVNILFSLDKRLIEGNEFKTGDVLVTDMTDPDWEPIMKKASAIVTNKGGRTCHAAIVARELGVPAIVGCGNATKVLHADEEITVSCAEGETGFIYKGIVDYSTSEYDLNDLPPIDTTIMLNVASPSMCFKFSHLPNSGVGLAREEFIINNYIQVHPLALLHHKELNDIALTQEIEKRIFGYENEEDFFIKKLSYGIAKIGAAFYPNPVIVRFSDFKTNEYYNLLGGNHFEPHEENPMIGWRGASRYYSKEYKAAF